MSARWISVSTSSPCAGWQATPIEPPIWSVVPSTSNGSRRRSSRPSATFRACTGSATPCSRIPNSSPPSRATVSLARSVARSRTAASCSSRSPWWWPSVSLISLKWSRSISITRAAAARAAADMDRLLDAVAEQDAVGQPRERVVDRLVRLRDRGAAAAVDREQRQEQQRHEHQRVVGGQHDDRREPEHQAGRRGLREPVLDEIAPDRDALDHRDDRGDDRRVDDEEDERRRHDRRQVGGRVVELLGPRHVRERGEHQRCRDDGQRVLRHVEGDLVRGLAPREVGDEVGQQQAGQRRLDAAGDQQRDRERRRRRSSPPRRRACRPSAAPARRAARRARRRSARARRSGRRRTGRTPERRRTRPPRGRSRRRRSGGGEGSASPLPSVDGFHCRMIRHPHLEPAPSPSMKTTSRPAVHASRYRRPFT